MTNEMRVLFSDLRFQNAHRHNVRENPHNDPVIQNVLLAVITARVRQLCETIIEIRRDR